MSKRLNDAEIKRCRELLTKGSYVAAGYYMSRALDDLDLLRSALKEAAKMVELEDNRTHIYNYIHQQLDKTD